MIDWNYRKKHEEAYYKALKKFSNREDIPLFSSVYDFAEKHYCEFTYMDKCFGKDHIKMYPIMFEKFKYNRYLLYTNGETLHNLTHNLENKINEKCFPVIELRMYYHFIKIAFITESGKFYLDNGEYLGFDYLNVADNFFTKDIGVSYTVCKNIFVSLKKAGWYEGRKVDISLVREIYKQAGLELFSKAEKFFEEFTGITIKFWFGGQQYYHEYTIGDSEVNFFHNLRPEEIQKYLKFRYDESIKRFEEIGERVLQIGSAGYQFFMGESGKFYVTLPPDHLFCIGDDPFVFISWLYLQ